MKTVQDAAEYLDDVWPGWANSIDLSILDMGNSEYCVLGQVFRDDAANDPAGYDNGYEWALDNLDGNPRSYNDAFDDYDDEWKAEIAARLNSTPTDSAIPLDKLRGVTSMEDLSALIDEYDPDREITITLTARAAREFLNVGSSFKGTPVYDEIKDALHD